MSDTRTRTEWAAELTWPDGHVEHRTASRLDRTPFTRRDAEICAQHNANDPDLPAVKTRVLTRTVTTTVTAWAEVNEVALRMDEAEQAFAALLVELANETPDTPRTETTGSIAARFQHRSRPWVAQRLDQAADLSRPIDGIDVRFTDRGVVRLTVV